jgi:hypothetical protein
MQTFSTFWPVALAFAALSTAACGSSAPMETEQPPSKQDAALQTFVGSLEGTDAVVGLVRKGELWAGYVCGGPSSYATLTGWYQGRVEAAPDGQHDRLIDPDGSWSGTLIEGTLAGALLGRDGVARNFRASLAGAPGGKLVGLFEAVDSGCRTGFIVMPVGSGGDSVTQGVWCDGSGRFAQVTPILPVELGARGVRVQVSEPGRELYVVPAIPPLGNSLGS